MNNLPTTQSNGAARPLGCLPPRRFPQNGFAPVDAAIPLINEADWTDTDNAHLLWDLLDQDGQGACNACAATLTIEGTREQQGLPRVKLSWGNLYGQINHQRDEGSILEDAHLALEQWGVADAATIPLAEWHDEAWPPNWLDNAAAHCLLENWLVPTFRHLASAAIAGWFFDCGIPVGPDFTPDANGVLPPWRGPIRGYHAVCGRGLRRINNVWHIGAKNSWGPWGWQNTGLFWIPRSYFFDDVADAFAPRVSTYSRKDQTHVA